MFNAIELWKQRFQLFLKEVRRYVKYIFNDHLKFILIFAIGIGAYYYQQWLETLSSSFPAAFILAVLFGVILTAGSVQTLLKQADVVFLLPLEKKMNPYFQRAFVWSYMMQIYILIIAGAAAAPLYMQQLKKPFSALFLFLLLAALIKAWNMFVTWEISLLTDEKKHLYDSLVRFGINFLFCYFLFVNAATIWLGCLVFLMITYLTLLHQSVKTKSLKWEYLIAEEEKRMTLFYRVANMFTDVPMLKTRVKRRRWLDLLASLAPDGHVYLYLYIRTFLRSGDYLGVYVRLSVIGAILLYFVPFFYARLAISVLFLYFIGFQLITLWKHHQSKLWIDLYPVSVESRTQSFQTLLFVLLFIVSIIFSAVIGIVTASFVMTGIIFGISTVFVYIFSYRYVKTKL
ncbi:ABC transporter permease [Bacillus sp. 165]|uniref:ABC transporter permease n=1 Tax=Bacillus sp. 165 TaxID=1529117 RepID=UPI001ADC49B4|nr:ABC transporter permease [Bacillus sp. 165]MBO9128725.1 ABC transporter permease [Bacillus sp. 165]